MSGYPEQQDGIYRDLVELYNQVLKTFGEMTRYPTNAFIQQMRDIYIMAEECCYLICAYTPYESLCKPIHSSLFILHFLLIL